MIDNTTQWFLWSVGWTCLAGAALWQSGGPAALAVVGAGFLRASNISMESSFSALFSALMSLLKPGVK